MTGITQRAAKPLEINGFGGFILCFSALSQLQHILDKALHAGSAILPHAVREMTVFVQGKGGGGVSQVALDGLYIIPRPDGVHRVGMPLWHNKDKSESPCGATGWRFVLILFPLKSGLKMGSTGGGDKQGLHLKDKFSHANSSAIILCNSSHKLLICFGIVVHICLIPAIILPAYLRIENARTCTTSSLGIFFKVSR